jgi:hypothetical protein
MLRWARSLTAAALCGLVSLAAASSSPTPAAAPSTGFTNNWAVLVCTVSRSLAHRVGDKRLTSRSLQSRYWFNYRVREPLPCATECQPAPLTSLSRSTWQTR